MAESEQFEKMGSSSNEASFSDEMLEPNVIIKEELNDDEDYLDYLNSSEVGSGLEANKTQTKRSEYSIQSPTFINIM